MPFQDSVGTAFDQSHRAVFVSTAEFRDKGGIGCLSITHFPLARTTAPQTFTGPAFELVPGKPLHLALQVGSQHLTSGRMSFVSGNLLAGYPH